MDDYYLNKMDEFNADGIDFMRLWPNEGVLKSYTREEFERVKVIPPTSYRYWKMANGKKQYVDEYYDRFQEIKKLGVDVYDKESGSFRSTHEIFEDLRNAMEKEAL